MRKRLIGLLGISMLAMTVPANAAPVITYSTQPDGSFTAFFGDTPKVASFNDLFTSFTITNVRGGLLTATLSTSGISTNMDMDFVIAEILGPGGLQIPFALTKTPLTGPVGNLIVTNPDGLEQGLIGGVTLLPGTYTLHITGTTSGLRSIASLGGTLNYIATPAPEPATWALLILGFGGIGFAMRRRQSADAVAGRRLALA